MIARLKVRQNSRTIYICLVLFGIFNTILGEPPEELTECGFPGAPAHSEITFSDDTLSEGTVATYTCERGFELLGPSRRVCKNDRWLPEGIPFCVLNVAAGKAPMQSSTADGGAPQKAVDGSTTSGNTEGSLPVGDGSTCSLTQPERAPWWYVNLLEPYMVQLVRLDLGRLPTSSGAATLVVRVGNNRPDLGTNPICNRFTLGGVANASVAGQPLFLPCNPPMPGAFVSVHAESHTPKANSQLSICEAFVYTDQALPIERCPQFRDAPPGSTATYNGKCYVFYARQPKRFTESVAFCRSRGGTLVDESNPALQGFISWELWRRHRSETHSQYWLGLIRDQHRPANWRWVDSGRDVTVSFWSNPPGSNDCARYDGSKGWLWSDTNCDLSLNYICQHQPKTCGRPEQPPNSTMIAENFNVGSSVEYSCDEGHLLVGPTTRTCLDTGFYNEFPPVCKRIQCGLPADIQHGGYRLLNGSIGYMAHAIYSCEEGYEMTGRARLVCDLDGRWNGPPPVCEPTFCGEPPVIANGRFHTVPHNNGSSPIIFGSIIRYECARGYKLIGTARIVCQADGRYDSPSPYCGLDDLTTTTRIRPPTTIGRLPTTIITRPTKPTRPSRPSTIITHSIIPPISAPPTTVLPIDDIEEHPGTVKEERPRRPSFKPGFKPAPRPELTNRPIDTANSGSVFVPSIVAKDNGLLNAPIDDFPIDNSLDRQLDERPDVQIPLSVDAEHRPRTGLNVGAVVALAAVGATIFIIAVVTTIVVLVKRTRRNNRNSGRHYRHRASPDSYSSSSTESRNGLGRYYRQAWNDLHAATKSQKTGEDFTGNRKTSEDVEASRANAVDSSNRNSADSGRDRGGSGHIAGPGQKGRRHHHHHHHHERGEYRGPQTGRRY